MRKVKRSIVERIRKYFVSIDEDKGKSPAKNEGLGKIIVFVDYRNLEKTFRSRGLEYLAVDCLSRLSNEIGDAPKRAEFRLYSGWYEYSTLSKEAQDLAIEIGNTFPKLITFFDGSDYKKCIVNMELARSLLIAPGQNLLHTYREKSAPYGVQGMPFPASVCIRQKSCPVKGVAFLFKKRRCGEAGCKVKIDDLLFRSEQKMVDGMLCADITHVLNENLKLNVIISSDDDIWPIIMFSVYRGIRTVHIDCKKRISSFRQSISSKMYVNTRLTL